MNTANAALRVAAGELFDAVGAFNRSGDRARLDRAYDAMSEALHRHDIVQVPYMPEEPTDVMRTAARAAVGLSTFDQETSNDIDGDLTELVIHAYRAMQSVAPRSASRLVEALREIADYDPPGISKASLRLREIARAALDANGLCGSARVAVLIGALANISLAEQESSTSAVDKVRDMGRTARTALANYRKATETT